MELPALAIYIQHDFGHVKSRRQNVLLIMHAHYKQSFDRNFGGSGGSGGNHNGGGNGSGCGPLLLIIVVAVVAALVLWAM